MNRHLRASAEFHTTFLNTLQTAILYDLCDQADETGESKPDIKAMAFRWRVHEKTVRWMISELEVAGLVEKIGFRVIVRSSLLVCQEGCLCPLGKPSVSEQVSTSVEKAPKPEKKPKKRFDISAPPDPGSLSGTYEKLKTHWRTRWGTAVLPGHLERALGEVVRQLIAEGGGNLNNFERAFANYLQAAKDSESGKISLKNFASTWGVWTNPAGRNTTQDDAVAAVKDALGLDL